MEQGAMIWTAWNNGEHFSSGAGYGSRISIADRDAYFDRSWKIVTLELPAESGTLNVEANVDKSAFWGPKCWELINKGTGSAPFLASRRWLSSPLDPSIQASIRTPVAPHLIVEHQDGSAQASISDRNREFSPTFVSKSGLRGAWCTTFRATTV
jgi:hypothetical protein